MDILPLPKKFYDRAIALKITSITLHWSGGSDEGNMYIGLNYSGHYTDEMGALESDIEKWAWNNYDYNGAGDGNDYGDDITYDLEENTAAASEWYTSRVEGPMQSIPLAIEPDPIAQLPPPSNIIEGEIVEDGDE